MAYRYNPNPDRYGGYDKQKELELAEIDSDRELRNDDDEN